MVTLERHVDEDSGFSLLVPREWERVDQPTDEVRFVAVEPLDDQGFRANVVVTVDTLPPGLTLDAWQGGNDTMMATMMDGWHLLDRYLESRRGDAGEDVSVVRRLGHHVVGGMAPVTMRQLAMATRGRGYTLTTSIWTPTYPDMLAMVCQFEDSFTAGPPDVGSPAS